GPSQSNRPPPTATQTPDRARPLTDSHHAAVRHVARVRATRSSSPNFALARSSLFRVDATPGPNYQVSARAKCECDVVVLVVTPKRATARWARRPIPLGGGNAWTPLVVGPDDIPPVTDSDRARELPELGALSIIAHGKGEPELAMRIAKATLHGLEAVGDEDTRMYFDLIESHLSQAARKALAMTFEGYQFQSKFGNKRFAEGKAEGRAEGRAEGKLEGRRAILR